MAEFTPSGQPAPMRPGEFLSGSVANQVTYKYADVEPPTQLYIQRDDQLIVQAMTDNSAEVITVSGRLLVAPYAQGRNQPDVSMPSDTVDPQDITNVMPFSLTVKFTTAFVPVQASLALAEGFLLQLSVSTSLAATRGECFVRVGIQRGGGITWTTGIPLVADYVTKNAAIGWPGGRFTNPTDGSGQLRYMNAGNPAAGADYPDFVPTNVRWRLYAFQMQLVTAVAVANRIPTLLLIDTTTGFPYYTAPPNAVIAASLTAQVVGTNATPPGTAVATDVYITMPEDVMVGTQQLVRFLTANIRAADQYSRIVVAVEQWMDF